MKRGKELILGFDEGKLRHIFARTRNEERNFIRLESEVLHEKDLEKHVAPAIRGHMRDWLQAVATRGKPVADIEQGHVSSASCILANLSAGLHRTLDWDPATHKVRGDEEANNQLARVYRGPWKHPIS